MNLFNQDFFVAQCTLGVMGSSSCVESNQRDKTEVCEVASEIRKTKPSGKTDKVSPAEVPEGENVQEDFLEEADPGD